LLASLLLSSLQKFFLIYATPNLFAPRVPAGAAGTSWQFARYRHSESRSDTREGLG
jgi:hypothetical protein